MATSSDDHYLLIYVGTALSPLVFQIRLLPHCGFNKPMMINAVDGGIINQYHSRATLPYPIIFGGGLD